MTAVGHSISVPDVPVIVLHMQGEVDISVVNRLWDRLVEALALHPGRLVVDLSGCQFVDAQAMGVLLDAHRQAWKQGGRLILRGCSEPIHRLLALAGIDQVFSYEPAGDTPPRPVSPVPARLRDGFTP